MIQSTVMIKEIYVRSVFLQGLLLLVPEKLSALMVFARVDEPLLDPAEWPRGGGLALV